MTIQFMTFTTICERFTNKYVFHCLVTNELMKLVVYTISSINFWPKYFHRMQQKAIWFRNSSIDNVKTKSITIYARVAYMRPFILRKCNFHSLIRSNVLHSLCVAQFSFMQISKHLLTNHFNSFHFAGLLAE